MWRRSGLLPLALALVAAPAAAEPWRATYTVAVAGVPVLEAEFRFTLEGPRYLVESRVRSLGLAALVMAGEQVARSEGVWHGGEPRPVLHETEGRWRGRARRTRLEYGPEGAPRVTRLEPAEDMPRSPVPEAALAGSLDTLSALLLLARRVRETARCDARATGFDGRRLARFEAAAEAPASAAEAHLLRCVIEHRVLAGYALDRDPAQARGPHRIAVVFERPAPDAPPLPLRAELGSRWWGRIEARLEGFTRG